MDQYARTIKLIGKDKQELLTTKKVAVFGLGGVGSYVVEALVRAGISHIVLVDNDTIDITNLNRQLYALHSTVGKNKVDVAKERCLDINPNLDIKTYQEFYLPGNNQESMFVDCDYVIDAIDTVKAKIGLIDSCYKNHIPIISCMGTGNKLDASLLEIDYIEKTSVCPLAKVMRKELKDRGIKKIKVLYTKEVPVKVGDQVPGSISYVPSTAGLLIASTVIKDLMEEE